MQVTVTYLAMQLCYMISILLRSTLEVTQDEASQLQFRSVKEEIAMYMMYIARFSSSYHM